MRERLDIFHRGGAAAAASRERERGRKGVRKRLPLRQMCAAKAADVDAYAAGWLTASLRSSKGSEPRFNHFISLFRTTRTRYTGLQCFVPAIIGNLIFFFNLHLFVLAVKEVLYVQNLTIFNKIDRLVTILVYKLKLLFGYAMTWRYSVGCFSDC